MAQLEQEPNLGKPLRIYIDGGFDLVHSGHLNAVRQTKCMCDELVIGINSDEDLLALKGPTVMNVHERSEIVRHCKFIDEVHADTEYTPTLDLIKEFGCDYYAHGDDPCLNSEGVEVTDIFKEKGRFKLFKRTEGVSTTDITGKLLAIA